MKESVISVLFACLLGIGVFWVMGGSVDTFASGYWAAVNDGHPEGEHSEPYHLR